MAAEQSGMTAGAGRAGPQHGPQQGPQRWAFALFLAFGAAQLIAGLAYFFAYNWRALPDMAKIALPQAVMVFGFMLWAALPRPSRLGAVAGLAASAMIGVSMAVVGQVYQLGADPWRLFAIWAAFVLPLAAVMRSDAQLALAAAAGSIAYFLYTDEAIRPLLSEPQSVILAVYTAAAAACLFLREAVSGGAPRWLRSLLVFAALSAATIGGFADIFDGRHAFDRRFWASLALLAAAAAFFSFYRYRRPDRPVQALAMFAAALWAGALGVRTIFSDGDIDSAAHAAGLFFLSACWIVAVTGALAIGFKRLRRGGGAA